MDLHTVWVALTEWASRLRDDVEDDEALNQMGVTA